MTETRGTSRHEDPAGGDTAIGASARKPDLGTTDMAYLVIAAIAAAFLAGILALPFTMPGAAHAASRTVPGSEIPSSRQPVAPMT